MIYINEHAEELELSSALEQVSEQRREQALRFRHETGQRLCLAVYLLLKQGLYEEYGISENPLFDYNSDGKPFLIGHPDIHFNFSHSGHVAVCAISDRPVGVDVEILRRVTPELIAYTMDTEEQNRINAAPDPAKEFLGIWTKKEAVLKLSGEGIHNNMKSVLKDACNCDIETIFSDRFICSIAQWKNLPDR